jgi:hypothetical protein
MPREPSWQVNREAPGKRRKERNWDIVIAIIIQLNRPPVVAMETCKQKTTGDDAGRLCTATEIRNRPVEMSRILSAVR